MLIPERRLGACCGLEVCVSFAAAEFAAAGVPAGTCVEEVPEVMFTIIGRRGRCLSPDSSDYGRALLEPYGSAAICDVSQVAVD